MGNIGGWLEKLEGLHMHNRFLVMATLLITPLIAGCAQIKSFSVAPSTVCPGETVKIDWQASGNSGNVTLDAIPPLEGMGEVATEGSRSLTPRKAPAL